VAHFRKPVRPIRDTRPRVPILRQRRGFETLEEYCGARRLLEVADACVPAGTGVIDHKSRNWRRRKEEVPFETALRA
jgi:hypothetical protein